MRITDTRECDLPTSPIPGSAVLFPLKSWQEIYIEHRRHGIDFDAFWYESLEAGICSFYRWSGSPRSVVLAVFDTSTLRHIECRKQGDVELDPDESAPIVAELVREFARIGIRLAFVGPLQ